MNKIRQSCQEMTHINCIANTGILLAIAIVLGNFSISVGNYIRVSFYILPQQVVCYLYGPATGILFGILSDILRFIIKPSGPFFPGFTISSMLYGIIYGFFLYKSKLTYKRLIISHLLSSICINMLLNTYWLSVLYVQSYSVLLPVRILKELLILPIEILISIFVFKHIKRFYKTNI